MTDRQPSPPPTTALAMAARDAAISSILEQLRRDKVVLQRQLDDERRLRREAEDMADRQPSPPPTTSLGTAARDVGIIALLSHDKAVLQRQLDDERRLRREAEDIIDQRQDEVYERDAQLRELRSKLGKGSRRRKSSPRSPTSPRRESSDSEERTSGERTSGERLSPDDNERRRSGSSTKRKPVPASAPAPTTTVPPTISLFSPADPGLTKPQAMAAYAALIASVKSFVESHLAPVFALNTRDLETAVAAVHAATSSSPTSASAAVAAAAASTSDTLASPMSPASPTSPSGVGSTYYTMSRPRTLLKLMTPRARMFLRLKGADSVHFYAILMEFLRRRVFAEPYGGVFKTATGPVPPLPITTTATPAETNILKNWLQADNDRRTGSKVEARLVEVDDLATRVSALLDDVDRAYTGPRVPWAQFATATAPAAASNTSPSTSAGNLGTGTGTDTGTGTSTGTDTGTTRPSSSTRPRHQHSVSDGATPTLGARPSSLRHEARQLRVQLLDRVLAGNASSSLPISSASASSLPLSARVAGLSSYIDTRVRQLSAELARALLPLQLALAFSQRSMADTPPAARDVSNRSGPPSSAATAAAAAAAAVGALYTPQAIARYARDAVDLRAITYATLERAIATDLVRPAVELAVALQLAVPSYAVRWVEHAHDSPSLSVCEALGLDYQRIQFGKGTGSGGDEDQYSFVFDISPALFMKDPGVEAKPTTERGDAAADGDIIYAQGVLLQKGEVHTERTFVHWLHETGVKPKGSTISVPSGWRRKVSGPRR